MESGVIKISQKELHRYHVLKMVLEGRLSLKEAAKVLGVSYRQAKRLKKDAQEGVRGLVHGNRGRQPWNKIPEELRERIVELSQTKYKNFNDSHFTEMLEQYEQLKLSDETVRVIRRAEKIKPKQKRRPPKHRSRRPRKAQEGLMILWDGSPHRWFGKDHPPCCAMTAIDDARGNVLALFLCEQECSWGYFELLRRIVRDYGIPASVYQDRHSALKRNDDYWSIEEELAGRQEPTQVGAALDKLGIEAITALSPQAKGRVERLFRTLQDRLVAMLEFKGIESINEANEYIDESFIAEFNDKFAVDAEDSESAWVKVDESIDLDRIISFRYDVTVANDNAIRFGGMIIDVPPGTKGKSYAGVKAQLRQLLDGSWKVYHQDTLIAEASASPLAEPIRARSRRKGTRAAYDSQWVYLQSASLEKHNSSSETASTTSARGTMKRAKPSRVIGATRLA